MSDDDWGDMDETSPIPRMPRSHRRRTGPSQSQRFGITLAVTAGLMLLVGFLAGMAIGRATTPVPKTPKSTAVATQTPEPTVTPTETPPAVEPTAAPSVEESAVPETVEPTFTPPGVRQLSPANGAQVSGSRVPLTWSKVTPPAGLTVTYSFDIETYSGGKWGSLQTITGLTSRSYSARVLPNQRRWRVWAVVDNVAGPKSAWRTYRGAPAPSRESTSTTTTP